MIEKLEMSAQHTDLTPELKKYVIKKIGRLDRYVSRHTRESVHAEVKLKEGKNKDKKQFTCTVIMQVPNGALEASETTINMFAAIDIVETKLKQQLRKYKEQQANPKLHRRLFSKLRRSDPTIH
jgi:putative sigma-54 modulation protein